ncbi:MAG: aspartate--tRNA ligase [Gemmatimonadota bacterium]
MEDGSTPGTPGVGRALTTFATAWRDARCGDTSEAWLGRRVKLAGWVHRVRDLGGVIFVQIRDRGGLVQLAFGPDWCDAGMIAAARDLSSEDVVQVEGDVVNRPPEAVNPEMATGSIEVHVDDFRVLSEAAPLPILVADVDQDALPAEELRLRHRVLDLRRPEMIRNFEVRHEAVAGAREALSEEGFLEIETPLLTRRTPEGARDYLVPSRVNPGEFYALPQSPQLYKQLLMVAGYDRYFQIARCLRDEDLRADRQPEFTQVDVEMAFVGVDDVLGVCERMLQRMWSRALGQELHLPFPRLSHGEALELYGTDKPDLRVAWKLVDLTDLLTGLGFGIFDHTAEAGGRVRGFVAAGGASLSRSEIGGFEELARERGAKGVIWLKAGAEGWSGPIAKYVSDDVGAQLKGKHGMSEGDLLLVLAGPDSETSGPLDAVRRAVASRLGAVDEGGEHWLWVVDFPLFERDRETGAPVAAHHPFTMPLDADSDRIREAPFDVTALAYDVVYNGVELASGSIRCHDAEIQRAILEALGFDREEAERRFGFLLEAFRYGAPPHGGYALGLDRTVALMVGAPSLRDVIAFPKTTAARGLMEGTPSSVEPEDLEGLHIQLCEDD